MKTHNASIYHCVKCGHVEHIELGAEPPLALFGMPIFVDERLERVPTLVMPAGTHQDAVELDTNAWMRAENAQPVSNLGLPIH